MLEFKKKLELDFFLVREGRGESWFFSSVREREKREGEREIEPQGTADDI